MVVLDSVWVASLEYSRAFAALVVNPSSFLVSFLNHGDLIVMI